MNIIESVVKMINTVLWDYVLLFGLVFLGVYLSIKLKFPQFKRVFIAFKNLIKGIIKKEEVPEGRMTPFQSLSTAIAAQVGTGNIIGVATAIAAGGPGAAFWMIVSAFFGMSTIFAEAVLAQKYREYHDGQLVGGPAYYIKNGLKSKFMANIFAIFCVIALGFVGIMVQSNSVSVSVSESFSISKLAVAIGLAIIVALILTGGMKRIAKFTEIVVPFMAFAYIIASIVLIIIFRQNFVSAISLIFIGAFKPQAIAGGALGIGVQQAMRFGVARGLFSNEAGMGSTPHSHAVASTDHPAEQGFIAMIGVFISTFLICMSTVMVSLSSHSYDPSVSAEVMSKTAALMTQKGFFLTYGSFGEKFLSVSLSFFSLTTIVGWYFFAEGNIKMLFNGDKKVISIFKVIVIFALFYGSFLKAGFVWQLADCAMGLMALPNIIALFLLSKQVKEILNDYDKQKAKGEELHYDYEFEKNDYEIEECENSKENSKIDEKAYS